MPPNLSEVAKKMTDSEKEKERIAYWLGVAEYDLGTAEAMLQTKRYLYVGFMCHQAIEKTLKAVYVKERKAIAPYTHNLSHLAKESSLMDVLSEEQLGLVATLNPMNIESRYPSYLDEVSRTLDEKVCVDLLARTKEFYGWLRNRL